MERNKLENWAELLLDTGKRNNLINFKNRYTSVAEIIYPSAFDIFSKSLADSYFEPVALGSDDRITTGEELSEEEHRLWFKETYSHKVTKSTDILLYAGENKSFNTIKNIVKKAKLALEETGVNIAYIAFGFIHWFESGKSEEMLAPILLVPVSFEGRGALKFPKIDVLESEITLNPSFVYKCEKEFGLKLPEYTDQPLQEYLFAVGQAIGGMGWFVSDECKISTFSFLKINMYRDLEDNADTILRNENIRILLGESSTSYSLERNLSSEDLHCIVDADSSQEEAILAVKKGKSIVLQGPPGTGKSQTITNIIAECLYDGKKVLFVSEKRAALNVVYEKLKKEGLADFCLELHSHKANKKDFLADLCSALKSEKLVLSDRAEREITEKNKAQEKLNGYKNALHTTCEKINKSPYELINCYFQCKNAPELTYEIAGINNIDEENFLKQIQILEEFKEYVHWGVYDYRDFCFYGYVDTDTSYSKIDKVQKVSNGLKKFFSEIEVYKNKASEKFRLQANNLRQIKNMGKLLTFLGNSQLFSPKLIESPNNLLASITGMRDIANSMGVLKNQLCLSFKKELLNPGEINATQIKEDLINKYNNVTSRLFLKGYKNIIKTLSAYLLPNAKINYKYAILCMEKLEFYQQLQKQFFDNEEKIKPCLGSAYKGVESDWASLIKEIDTFIALDQKNEFLRPLIALTNEEYETLKYDFYATGKEIEDAFEKNNDYLSFCDINFDSNLFSFKTADFYKAKQKIEKICENMDKLPEWCYFVGVLQKAKTQNLLAFIGEYLNRRLPLEQITLTYEREFYRSYIEYLVATVPEFSTFTRISQDKTVESFIEKDKLSLQVNEAKIRAKLCSMRPNLAYVAPGSDVSMILHEGAKKRMQKGVRRLLSEAGATIQLLKPCFLMSPLSVSTFLYGGLVDFDVVVFDEASQIFPQDAIGAIYRGKQLVVVGDSKQMPPSDFFMNTVTGAIDEEGADEEVSDYESILDICSACFTQKSLRWHYRSKHESLIAFSNKNFYDGNLITFPATKKKQLGLGVDYYNAGGVYEQKARINRREAEMVADLVFEHFEKTPERSLGVVAFNMAQQNYIEKIITNRRIANPAYEKYFREDNKEAFFVKNLETVQGDERDVIIFSIAYAKNTEGKFIHNFGPLNHKGGERRLNVAVTRAKLNVKLVCSINSADIDLTRTNAEGARLLKEYIAYAETGVLESGEYASGSAVDSFESEIAQFITDAGYLVELKLGESSAKIDIAVKDASGEEYVLAVECDGPSYASYKTARDRERLRKQILVASGWKYYRIWSIDWYKNRRTEQEKLLRFIENAVKFSKAGGDGAFKEMVKKSIAEYKVQNFKDIATDFVDNELEEDESEGITVEDTGSESEEFWAEPLLQENSGVDFGFPVYEMANVNALYAENSVNFQLFVKEVLKKEAPLCEKWFLRRIVHLFGRSVVNSSVMELYNGKMAGCEYNSIIRKNGFLYLNGVTEYTLRLPSHVCRRTIDCISLEELASGLMRIITHNVSIEKEGLFRTLAYRLGIMKMSAMIQVRMEQALMLLADRITVDGTTITKK